MAPPLRIVGLTNGERLLQPGVVSASQVLMSEQQALKLEVFSVGGQGERDWFLNGRHQGRTQAGAPVVLTFGQPGSYELVVLDQQGQLERLKVHLEEPSKR